MKIKRHWLGLRVWIANTDGKKHNGTLWWIDETSVVIRENGVAGLLVLPNSVMQIARNHFLEVESKAQRHV